MRQNPAPAEVDPKAVRNVWVAVGIDPGLTGGVAALGVQGGDREIVCTFAMPTRSLGGDKREVNARVLFDMLVRLRGDPGDPEPLVAIEKVGAMRKEGVVQGVTSAFTFGAGYGKVLAVLEILGWPKIDPTPQMWQKLVLKGRTPGKEASVAYCQSRYPDASLLPTERSKVPNHGLADALCLAEYAYRQRITDKYEKG
jgi:crossover junction endodeoxyribonuclease RuvC